MSLCCVCCSKALVMPCMLTNVTAKEQDQPQHGRHAKHDHVLSPHQRVLLQVGRGLVLEILVQVAYTLVFQGPFLNRKEASVSCCTMLFVAGRTGRKGGEANKQSNGVHCQWWTLVYTYKTGTGGWHTYAVSSSDVADICYLRV